MKKLNSSKDSGAKMREPYGLGGRSVLGREWSWDENKTFENAIAVAARNFPDVIGEVASRIPGKTQEQIQKHLTALVEDVGMIERGLIPLPEYEDYGNMIPCNCSKKRKTDAVDAKSYKQQRKKAVPWTKEEHVQFLMGLDKYGKGNWRSISRHCVVTRTPIQIASHAQKYFLRIQRAAARTPKAPYLN